MHKPSLLVEIYDLERLNDSCELTGGDVSVNVENLTIIGLCKTGEDGKSASTDTSFDGSLVNLCDLADELVLVLVKVVCGKDAASDGAGADTLSLECVNELEVLLEETAANDAHGLAVGDANAIDVVWLDALCLKDLVDLRPCSVKDDGEEADVVEERKRRGKFVEILGDNCTTDFDDGELLRVDRGEVTQILLDLSLRPDIV